MSAPDPSADDAKPAPLTPEAEALMRRARRGFGVSVGILLLGFMAIAGALVYRATRDDGGAASAYSTAALALPAGAEVVSALAADGILTVTYRIGSVTQMRLYDGRTGEMAKQIDLVSPAP